MKVSEILYLFNGNKAELGRVLGVTRACVSGWADDDIPDRHELRLRYEILPQLKVEQAKAKKKPAA